MQKIPIKSALAVAVSLGLATAAQAASNNIILGFNDAAGPSSAQNDYVIDLGSMSSFTTTSITPGTISSTLFTQAFGTDAGRLNNVAVGVVEGANNTSPRTLFMTAGGQPTTASRAAYNNALNAVNGAASFVGVNPSTTSGGFSDSVALSPSVVGSNATGGVAGNIGSNPLAYLVNGVATLDLWEATQTSSTANPSAFTKVGTFTVDVNNGTFNFTGVAAVPEPTTGALIAGGGLLLVALRRKLASNKA